jgi:hypothetical protein
MKHEILPHQVWTDGTRTFTVTSIKENKAYAIYHTSGREVLFTYIKKGKAKISDKWKLVKDAMMPPTKIIIPSRISHES